MREDILRHFAVDPHRVVVVHNGIDPGRFRRTERRDALDRRGVRAPYVLFVGRITDQKGIFHLLEAAGKLPARKVGRQWRFPRTELEKHVGESVE